MSVAQRAASFLGKMGAQIQPAMHQMNAAAQVAGENIANTVATNFGQIKNQMVNMSPLSLGSAAALGLGGMAVGAAPYMIAVKHGERSGKANPTSSGLGGALGYGVLGPMGTIGYLSGHAAGRKKARLAGEQLGSQLGVAMPPQY